MYSFPQQSTLPTYQPSRAFGCKPVSLGEAVFSPGLSGLRMVSNPRCAGVGMVRPDGLGQADVAAGSAAVIAVGIGLVVLVGFLSYQAGKAMAPNRSGAGTWGWIGVPVGLFTGAPGLGVMGWISNASK